MGWVSILQVTKVLNLEVTTEESVTDISKQKLLTGLCNLHPGGLLNLKMAENICSYEVCCPTPRTLKIQQKFLKSWKTACLKKLRKDDLNKKFRK